MGKVEQIVKAARPIHWIKNLALFAALIFTGTLFIKYYFVRVIWAFISFSLISSSSYLINDVLDIEKDKKHPIKRFRPIAAGKVSKKEAIFLSAALAIVSLMIASSLSPLFFGFVLGYLILQILYSLALKNFAILDILIVATGFIIRVYSGAVVINAHLSVWFLLCVISVALFLASGKRRAELSLVTSGDTRASLTKYKTDLLNTYVSMFGNAAWMSWALFTFFESPPADLKIWLFLAEISKATTINKLLMATIPVVIFIIMRYQSLIFEDRTEAPEKILLSDIPLVTSIAIYIIAVILILYGGTNAV